MKKIYMTILAIFMVAVIPLVALTVDTETETSTLQPFTKTIEDDYFGTGNRVKFSGEAEDVFLFGNNTDYSGTSTESAIIMGQDNFISGDIRNNLISAGNNVTISGNVQDTTFFAGNTFNLEESGIIGGDLYGVGQSVEIYGIVDGDLKVAAGYLTISGTIKGDVLFKGSRLVITDTGSIEGNLSYSTDRQINSDEKARVNGSINFNPDGFSDNKGFFEDAYFGNAFLWKLFGRVFFIISLLVVGMLILLIPGTERVFSLNNKKTFWNQTLLGFVIVICYPFATLLALIILPVSIAMMLATFPLTVIANILGSTAVGGYIMSLAKKDNSTRFINFLIGLGILLVLGFIPVLNFFVGAIYLAAGSGVVLSKIIEASRNKKKEEAKIELITE